MSGDNQTHLARRNHSICERAMNAVDVAYPVIMWICVCALALIGAGVLAVVLQDIINGR